MVIVVDHVATKYSDPETTLQLRICPYNLRVATHSQRVDPFVRYYLSAKVQSAYFVPVDTGISEVKYAYQ